MSASRAGVDGRGQNSGIRMPFTTSAFPRDSRPFRSRTQHRFFLSKEISELTGNLVFIVVQIKITETQNAANFYFKAWPCFSVTLSLGMFCIFPSQVFKHIIYIKDNVLEITSFQLHKHFLQFKKMRPLEM